MSHWGATLWGQVGLPRAKGPRELWGVCGGPSLTPQPLSGRTHRDPRAECCLPATRGAGVGMPTRSGRKGTEDPSFYRRERCPVRSRSRRGSGQGSGRQMVPAAALGKALVFRSAFPGPCYLRPRCGGPSGCPPCPRGEGGLNRAASLDNKQKLPDAWLIPQV